MKPEADYARGHSERLFGTLRARLPQELAKVGRGLSDFLCKWPSHFIRALGPRTRSTGGSGLATREWRSRKSLPLDSEQRHPLDI